MADSGWTRRGFLRTAGLAAAGIALSRSPSCLTGGVRRKPNFVFILVDDLGWADLGCYGSEYYETPNIDRLAAQGIRFTDGYAACAVCSPTRAAVMTGRYPARLGVTDWIRARFQGGAIPEDKVNPTAYVGGPARRLLCPPNALWMELDETTIAEALKPAGYTSCHIGKWHLGAEDWYPEKQGFDLNIGGCDFGQPPSYFDPYYREGQGGIPTLPPRREGEYLTDREADEAVRFITGHKDGPFFLYLANYAVHTPLQARGETVEKYKGKPPARQNNPVYAAMVESVDDCVGKVMAALDRTGLAEDTIVIFTSDNGGLLGSTNNAPLRSGKGFPYEGGIREPVIIRWPGVVRPGAASAEPVTSVDYFPTICEIAGVPLPAGRPIDGVSLAGYLRSEGREKLGRRAIYWHFPHYRDPEVPYSIIRSGDDKLIKRYEGPSYELFDLKNDLSETVNLADSHPEKVARLDAEIEAWLAFVEARLPRPNPGYEPPDAKR